MMLRWISAVLALWLMAGAAHADPVNRPIQPALFVVRDGDSTLYLFGTVHVRRPGSPWGSAEARNALAQSDEVWTEIIFSPEADAHARALALQLGSAPADRPLSSWLSADDAARLEALSRRLGLPPAMLERMRPWLAALTLTIVPIMQSGYDPNSGVDRAIDAAADLDGKRMRAFETAEEQLGIFANLSEEAQRQMLLDAVNDAERGPQQLTDLSAAWERGDLGMIERLVVVEMREAYPELYEAVFRRRNAAWVETLTRELDGAGVDFVAVGAGHLVGEEGLVEMLSARGYSVERVSPGAGASR